MSFFREQVVKRFTRSPHWSKVRKRRLEKQKFCQATGLTTCLEVHHIIPFNERPDLELADGTGEYCQIIDPRTGKYWDNLIVLSDDPKAPAHRFVGHLGDWQTSNQHVVEDAALWLQRIQSRRRKNEQTRVDEEIRVDDESGYRRGDSKAA